MADRPILFSSAMVRALLDGRKTQTRRVLKPAPFIDAMGNFCAMDRKGKLWNYGQRLDGKPCLDHYTEKCVRFAKGDRLYVRETWRAEARWDYGSPAQIKRGSPIYYAADPDPRDSEPGCAGRKRPGIHMPRWASRLTLTVTDVRVQRVQEISEEDARAEGALRMYMDNDAKFYEIDDGTYRCGFCGLWAHINGIDAWDSNPWIIALTFTVERRNIDAARAA